MAGMDVTVCIDRPIKNSGERVTPDELVMYRATHAMLGPGCLCGKKIVHPDAFVEACIFCVQSGKLSGLWVAACARKACSYFVILERYYPRLGLSIHRYPMRTDTNPAPPPVVLDLAVRDPPPEVQTRQNTPQQEPQRRALTGPIRRPLERARQRIAQINNRPAQAEDVFDITPVPAEPRVEFSFKELLKLDSSRNPGLTVPAFKALFWQCRCGLVMTKGAHIWHKCEVEVIDLTGED
ncbi:hypothetical protein C8Q76DRAFT_801372 [Earliella scabrosa]|nr:hypothetical protein C8Q76DRAFT_801372 [Earliella scabrosa]